MARINIEDTLWADPRFQELMIKVGNRWTAKGMVLELWTVAQKYWLASRGRGIPKPAWSSAGLPEELIACGMARDDGEFIYAIGSKEQFAWLTSCSEKGKSGGPAAAKSRREKTGKSKRPKSSENVTERHGTSSYSSSSSFSLSSSGSDSCSSVSAGSAPPITAAPELLTESTQDILERVSREVQDTWLKTYPDAGWIRLELAKAWAWCKANPQKAPRSNWARFANGWLSRGWEDRRKGIPANRAEARSQGNQATLNEYLNQIGGDRG